MRKATQIEGRMDQLTSTSNVFESLWKSRKLVAFLFLIFWLPSCKTTKTRVKTTPSSFVSQDKLGNIYQISDMKMMKYSSVMDTLQTNSIFSNGVISSLDTRNPLQLMLFYKQQQEVILLDNTLSETNKISLNFFEWVDLVCLSNRDNAFWLYSITTQTLIKTDKNGNITNRFKNIGQLVQKEINPIQLIEYENSVYLFDPNHGLFMFDLFGNYVKRIQLEKAERIKFHQKKVFFKVKNSIFSYNLINFDKKIELELAENFEDFEPGNQGILILNRNKIYRHE